MEILRKARNILSLAFLALAPAYAACSGGDPCASDMDCKRSESCVENTCESLDDLSADASDNDCHSPLYGGDFWQSTCGAAFHFREDCRVGRVAKGKGPGYVYEFESPYGGFDGMGYATYEGMDMTIYFPDARQLQDRVSTYHLDQDFRYDEEGNPKVHMINELLDRFGGFVILNVDDCTSPTNAASCVFYQTNQEYPGMGACRDTEYYINNHLDN